MDEWTWRLCFHTLVFIVRSCRPSKSQGFFSFFSVEHDREPNRNQDFQQLRNSDPLSVYYPAVGMLHLHSSAHVIGEKAWGNLNLRSSKSFCGVFPLDASPVGIWMWSHVYVCQEWRTNGWASRGFNPSGPLGRLFICVVLLLQHTNEEWLDSM
jgi:hypothetical protein